MNISLWCRWFPSISGLVVIRHKGLIMDEQCYEQKHYFFLCGRDHGKYMQKTTQVPGEIKKVVSWAVLWTKALFLPLWSRSWQIHAKNNASTWWDKKSSFMSSVMNKGIISSSVVEIMTNTCKKQRKYLVR